MVIIGIALVAYSCGSSTCVVQKNNIDEYGDIDLSFPYFTRGRNNIKECLINCSAKNSTQAMINAEKKSIRDFYLKINQKSKINFLSVSLFPFIVYAGYVVGEAGRKIGYYHYDRNREKSRKLRRLFWGSNQLSVYQTIDGTQNTTLAIYVSYFSENFEEIKDSFQNDKIIILKADKIGTESIKNRHDLEKIAGQVREFVAEQKTDVNLLLCCPAELCFAIGQKLKSPALPKINVYNYYRGSKGNKWNWKVTLD